MRYLHHIVGARLCRTIAVALGASLGAWGCRDVLGVRGYIATDPSPPDSGKTHKSGMPRSDGGPTFVEQCGNVGYASEECATCIQGSEVVCKAAQVCAGVPGCNLLAECLAKCDADDALCRVKCNESIRRTSEMSAFMVAAANHCPMCAVARPTFGGLGCETCIEALKSGPATPKSGKEILASVATNLQALELDACQRDCPPKLDKCACTEFVKDGESTLNEVKSLCKSECMLNASHADVNCLGNVRWPEVNEAMPLDLHVSAVDIKYGQPLPDASVSVCADDSCSPALDTNGKQVPPARLGDDGFAVFQGLTSFAGNEYLDHIQVDWRGDMETVDSHALFYFFPGFRRSPTWTVRRAVARKDAEDRLAGIPGLLKNGHLEWDRFGGVIWSAATCDGLGASGLTAHLVDESDPHHDDLSSRFYCDLTWIPRPFGNGPNELSQTVGSGMGVFVNVPPGQKILTLYADEANDVRYGVYAFKVEVGKITTLALTPGDLHYY